MWWPITSFQIHLLLICFLNPNHSMSVTQASWFIIGRSCYLPITLLLTACPFSSQFAVNSILLFLLKSLTFLLLSLLLFFLKLLSFLLTVCIRYQCFLRGRLMKNWILMDIYKPLGETRNAYHNNEEISHSKGHFSHPGSCPRIPYLRILENQRKLH